MRRNLFALIRNFLCWGYQSCYPISYWYLWSNRRNNITIRSLKVILFVVLIKNTIECMRNLNSRNHRIFNGSLGSFLSKYCGYREYLEEFSSYASIESANRHNQFKLLVDTVEIFNIRFVKRVHFYRPPTK